MLEEVIQNIIKSIKSEVVTSQMDTVPLNYLMSRRIPDSVKHFFDQEVEIWLREESDKFASSERFDYDLPEVRVLIDKIFDILKQSSDKGKAYMCLFRLGLWVDVLWLMT